MRETDHEPVAITILMHRDNFNRMQRAATTVGLSESEFCVLAIHREAGSAIEAHQSTEERIACRQRSDW
jgi:uncharacterized protein (DUF1778 family)